MSKTETNIHLKEPHHTASLTVYIGHWGKGGTRNLEDCILSICSRMFRQGDAKSQHWPLLARTNLRLPEGPRSKPDGRAIQLGSMIETWVQLGLALFIDCWYRTYSIADHLLQDKQLRKWHDTYETTYGGNQIKVGYCRLERKCLFLLINYDFIAMTIKYLECLIE